MSKYGFNENEVKKTIVTMIDKDGFHKETVYDGKYEADATPGDTEEFSAEGYIYDNPVAEAKETVIFVINVPDNAEVIGTSSKTDIDYEMNIGDNTQDVPDIAIMYNPFTVLPTIQAAGFTKISTDGKVGAIAPEHFYQIYAVDSTSHKVLKRVKIELTED